jgi:hypothetical protein
MTPRLALAPALVSFDSISRAELNHCLVAWDHRMGAWRRPDYREWFHGMSAGAELVGVTAAADLIKEPVAGFRRSEAIELGRLCAARPNLCRVVLRLWREFVFPSLCKAHGVKWVVSYQDADIHTGNTYRFDGWLRLAASRSGTDRRGGVRGRNKIVWGWCIDPAALELKKRELRTAPGRRAIMPGPLA